VHPKYLIVVHLKLRKTAREGETSFVICFKDLKLFIYRRCLDWRQLQIDSIKAHISGSSQIPHICPSSSGGPDGRPGRHREDSTHLVATAAAAVCFAAVFAEHFASKSFGCCWRDLKR
jgi:hypothetical protein